MFAFVVIVPIYILAIVAMCFMDSVFKALMFFIMLLILTFLMFLFINHPLPSALSVCCIIAMFAFRFKD
ncbi:hypothetical protein [Pedobacter aquatilis]|uniref:hypothetical protein n=1 Tax=Pedobacter aquatilis TaxID=351343 RepID=UPI0029310ADE|nr:hypothetical protein [Pedobacter aquatilis]